MLSDHEQKVLQELEQQLVLEDPVLAQALCGHIRTSRPRSHMSALAWMATGCCWLVVCLMVAAGMTQAALKVLSTGALLLLMWRLWHVEARPRDGMQS